MDDAHIGSLILLRDGDDELLAEGSLIEMIAVFCGTLWHKPPISSDLSPNSKRRNRWAAIARLERDVNQRKHNRMKENKTKK